MAYGPWGSNADRGTTPVVLTNVEEVLQEVEVIISNAIDFTEVWDVIGSKWVMHEEQAFAEGQGSWIPLQSETLRKKQPMTKILEDYGVMKHGLTDLRPRFARSMFAAYGPRKYDRRVMNPAVLHAVGTQRMPKRVPVPKLTPTERATWIKVLRDHVQKVIRDSQ